jgi:hypothetical protein
MLILFLIAYGKSLHSTDREVKLPVYVMLAALGVISPSEKDQWSYYTLVGKMGVAYVLLKLAVNLLQPLKGNTELDSTEENHGRPVIPKYKKPTSRTNYMYITIESTICSLQRSATYYMFFLSHKMHLVNFYI